MFEESIFNVHNFHFVSDFKSQQSNDYSNSEVLDANISDDNSRRCESEQSFVFKSQYSRARNKPYILNIKRAKEKEIPENVIVMSETNHFPISPSCDFYDSSESQNPRTQRYILILLAFQYATLNDSYRSRKFLCNLSISVT